MNNEYEDILDGEEEEEFDLIVLEDEETGEDVELVVIDSVEEGSSTYLLVVERGEFDDECPNAAIIREFKDENGEYVYEVVDDDDEFERASKYFTDFED